MKKFCAHRGISALMPENTLPSFFAALSLGADEIEFDVRLTKDQQLIVSHDGKLERISDGEGALSEYTLAELKKLNVGVERGWTVPFCTAEEVFAQLANKMVFNIHLKEAGTDGYMVKQIHSLAEKYGAMESIYFAGSPDVLAWMEAVAPEIPRVAIQLPRDQIGILEMAKTYHCAGVQFWRGMFDTELIDRIHGQELFCNLACADGEEEYDTFFGMGIDTILTNRMDQAADFKRKYPHKMQ